MFKKGSGPKQPKTMINGVSAGDLKGRGEGPKTAPNHKGSPLGLPGPLYTETRRGKTENYGSTNKGRT